MLYRKIHNCVFRVLYSFSLLTLSFLGDGCMGQKERKIDVPTFTIEAESFISNSGNISVVNEKKNVVSVQTKEDDAWLFYKINVPLSGKYTIRLYAKNVQEKNAVCWLEDYFDNKDGKTYNVSGNMIVGGNDSNSREFVQKDSSPMTSSSHYLKLHIEEGAVIFDKLTFTLIREENSFSNVSYSKTEGNWQLVWSDEFNGHGLPDSNKWIYDTEGNSAGWGNNEEQCYTVLAEKKMPGSKMVNWPLLRSKKILRGRNILRHG